MNALLVPKVLGVASRPPPAVPTESDVRIVLQTLPGTRVKQEGMLRGMAEGARADLPFLPRLRREQQAVLVRSDRLGNQEVADHQAVEEAEAFCQYL
jgi:hypothetical protein